MATTGAGALYYWIGRPLWFPPSVVATTKEESADSRIQQLDQALARERAETEQLQRTVAELKSSLLERGSGSARAAPFRDVRRSDDWMDRAVAAADAEALPQLEQVAQQNNAAALEAIGQLSRLDAGAALVRVWQSGKLNLANLQRATHLLGATMEVNPQTESILQLLFTDANADPRLLRDAVEGVADVGLQTPQTLVDFHSRLALLDLLQTLTTDKALRELVAHTAAELRARVNTGVP